MNSWKKQILSVPSSAVDLGWVILLAVACLPGALPAADAPPGLKQAAGHQPKPGGTFTNTIAMRFAYIPPGEFTMGSPKTEAGRSADETLHQVTLTKGWHLGIHPVTQAQWKSVMGGDSASRFKGDDLPVDEVLWNDAVTFCKKLSEKEGRRYRLPTSAEWEYACRAGTTTAFNTGDDEAALNEAGWFVGNSDSKTHPVGRKKPNAWGLYDMHGNVWQWCSDDLRDYTRDAVTNPVGPATGNRRVLRGGDWRCSPRFCRSAKRFGSGPNFRDDVFRGFRVALSDGAD